MKSKYLLDIFGHDGVTMRNEVSLQLASSLFAPLPYGSGKTVLTHSKITKIMTFKDDWKQSDIKSDFNDIIQGTSGAKFDEWKKLSEENKAFKITGADVKFTIAPRFNADDLGKYNNGVEIFNYYNNLLSDDNKYVCYCYQYHFDG